MGRPRTALEVLSQHQWPEGGDGGCTAGDGWGLAANGGPDDEQIARHQIVELVKGGFIVVRGRESDCLGLTVCRCDGEAHEHFPAPNLCPPEPVP